MPKFKMPPRHVRTQIGVIACCEERTVLRYFRDPNHMHRAVRNAIAAALPVVGVDDPHAAVVPSLQNTSAPKNYLRTVPQ